MDWFLSIIRIAGASFPVSSSLVQLQAEIDAQALSNRLEQLEDPISNLHEDIPELSKILYLKLKSEDKTNLLFNDEFYLKYSRALSSLESSGLIKAHGVLGNRYIKGITIIDPSFIVYLASIAENQEKMEALYTLVDECNIGHWLDGHKLDIDLPITVIRSVFDIFESKGYGVCSQTIGVCQYQGKS